VRRREFIALVGGAAVAWPLHAQQPAMPVIGFLSIGSPQVDVVRLAGFRQGLKESGYIEGHNVAIEYRAAEEQAERLPALAADLVRHPVSVIVVVGPAVALATKAVTTTVPIVFSITGDPVELGLVASLKRPGGNLTGITTLASTVLPKQFELLHEMMPRAVLIGFLKDPTNPHAESETRSMQAAADLFGRKLLLVKAGSEREIETAFAALVETRAGALAVGNSALFNSRPDQLVTLAARHALPAVYPYREFAAAGGLVSYGSSLADAYHLAGLHVARILKGEKPADLPVIQATKVQLVINLKSTKTLGLTVPQTLLARADELIE
jgi:putative ABC transport system substrate-binding protein